MSANDATRRGLCQRCCFLFSTQGLRELSATKRFRHSILGTFSDRPGCRFCSYLWNDDLIGYSRVPYSAHCLRDLVDTASSSTRQQKVNLLLASWVFIANKSERLGFYNVLYTAIEDRSTSTEDIGGIVITVESDTGSLLWELPHKLQLVTSADDPCRIFTNLRPLTYNGLSADLEVSLNSLLRACRETHTLCQPSGPALLPSRLLQIYGDNISTPRVKLRVASQENETGLYAALSYCWGGPQSLRLTKDNIDTFQENMTDSNTLPQTLKDAVIVTRLLGLEYLWIDSLCIIQDSVEDKEREIGRMCATYQNATVTIAAATSSSASEGFLNRIAQFSTRYPSCTVDVSLSPKNAIPHGSSSRISLVPRHIHDTENFPLNKRGWTYQEALLSPRLLVFGDLEPFIRCRTANVMRQSANCIQYTSATVHPRRIIRNAVRDGIGGDVESANDRSDELEFLWRELIEEYTRRDLTFPQDRQHAISGIVDFLSSTYGDKCNFGIWRSCAVACLLWKATPGRESYAIPDLPTWSWMSVTGQIDLDYVVYLDSPEALVEWDDEASIHVMHIKCCVVAGNEVYESMQAESSDLIVDTWADIQTSSDIRTLTTVLNFPVDAEGLYFLILGRGTNGNMTALVATSDEGTVYRRVGLAELRSSDIWLSKPRKDVLLE
ncbi:HET-domain-containing protein [Hypoxylon cercidicola]|nr:HET-domain-containing protein [Hypoxylon cercidicola]